MNENRTVQMNYHEGNRERQGGYIIANLVIFGLIAIAAIVGICIAVSVLADSLPIVAVAGVVGLVACKGMNLYLKVKQSQPTQNILVVGSVAEVQKMIGKREPVKFLPGNQTESYIVVEQKVNSGLELRR